ncbi:hypothetical protein RSAG8_03534, partial [Rhizoctonia solani AG-8 WAC10335]
MSLAGEYDPPSARDGNNPAPRPSQNKSQLLEATMRNVPKLKELNYTQWKNVITNSIKKAKLWGYVDGSAQEPSEHDASNLATYFDETAAVRNAILGSLEPGAQRYIEEALDPRDAWLALEKKYITAEVETDSKLVAIEKQLADLRLEEGGDTIEHIAEFCRMRYHLNGTRFAVDDQASISMLYRSLPASYRQSVLTPERTEMKNFNVLCTRLSDLTQNPGPQFPVEDYTSWGVPEDIKVFGLTGDKNPLLEERADVTCRDCLLKDHEAGTRECPQYEWRRELWGDPTKNENRSDKTNEGKSNKSNTRFIYEFSEQIKVSLSFQDLKLNEKLIQNLNHSKLWGPRGIQQCAVLPIINGRNVIAQAPPETGKTTAIILCIAQLTDTIKGGFQALVISPTEQKATDVQSMIDSLGYKCYKCSSSQSVRDNLVELAEGHRFPILVGTPDHILQHLRRGILCTSEIKILALDDLDMLVDNGFGRQLPDIYHYLPRSVQTLGTCSVLPSDILRESNAYIHKPLYVAIERFNGIPRKMTHSFVVIPQDGRSDTKPRALKQLSTTGVQTGILCATLAEVKCVQEQLNNLGYSYPYISTDMSPQKYEELVQNFRAYNTRQLITTSSVPLKRSLGAWSGANFWIVNFSIPGSPQNYSERVNYLGYHETVKIRQSHLSTMAPTTSI